MFQPFALFKAHNIHAYVISILFKTIWKNESHAILANSIKKPGNNLLNDFHLAFKFMNSSRKFFD